MQVRKINPKILRPLLAKRPKDCHKGDFGRVLIAAGSKGMSGAAILSARAALKAGAGLVTVAVPESQQPVVACAVPEALTLPLPESKNGSVLPDAVGTVLTWNAAHDCDVLLTGPGLSTAMGVFEFVRGLLNELRVPSVVDADALNVTASSGELREVFPKDVPCVLTPHPGEMGRLLSKIINTETLTRTDRAARLSFETGKVVVFKGHETIVTDAFSAFVNTTGGPALAKAGAGDVLAGFIAGFWAQHGRLNGFSLKTALESACLGVYVHGLCGDMAAKEFTERCVLAGELADYLPKALRKIRPGI